MSSKTLLLAGIAAATAIFTSAPANAVPILFQLSGAKTASFTIDSTTTPDFFSQSPFGNQISYNGVSGTFGGTPGTGSVGFGTSIFAQLNIGGTPLGFTQYGGSSDLFSIVGSRPVFNLGTFSLSSITSGPASITISSAVSAAPEPATWGMMIVGFGMVGGTIRYRRRKPSLVSA